MTDKQAISGEVLARDVSFELYMEKFAADHTEWVEGMVIKLSPVTSKHDSFHEFLLFLLKLYLHKTGVGIMRHDPFVMRPKPGMPGREPDIHIVLKERAHIVKDTITQGPADVVIEIVSPESVNRDKVEKRAEYEQGGVREYWILDPLEKSTLFLHLGADGKYQEIPLQNGVFHSRVLPHFRFDTRLFWGDELPNPGQIIKLVEEMLKASE
jgi:Uma2 family endonuclease